MDDHKGKTHFHCVWLNEFVWLYSIRGWIVVNEVYLVALIWEDRSERIDTMRSSIMWRNIDEIGNYKTVVISELEITKHLFSQGSISNFIKISIKKIKKIYNIYQIIPKLS